jgi:transcriptional regulator with XRE-family HTH domain
MDPKEVGGRIRAARENLGITQSALAAQVGVSRSAVAQWETGRSGQVGSNLAQIAAVLNVGVEHLLLGGGARAIAAEIGVAEGLAGDELALLRLYRLCSAGDRAVLVRTAHAFAKGRDSTGISE